MTNALTLFVAPLNALTLETSAAVSLALANGGVHNQTWHWRGAEAAVIVHSGFRGDEVVVVIRQGLRAGAPVTYRHVDGGIASLLRSVLRGREIRTGARRPGPRAKGLRAVLARVARRQGRTFRMIRTASAAA